MLKRITISRLFNPCVSYVLNRTTTVLFEGWFFFQYIASHVWYVINQRNKTKPIDTQADCSYEKYYETFGYFYF